MKKRLLLTVASAERIAQNHLYPFDGFIFEVNSGNLNKTRCAETRKSLQWVGEVISNDILFKVPIKVKVSFDSNTTAWSSRS